MYVHDVRGCLVEKVEEPTLELQEQYKVIGRHL